MPQLKVQNEYILHVRYLNLKLKIKYLVHLEFNESFIDHFSLLYIVSTKQVSNHIMDTSSLNLMLTPPLPQEDVLCLRVKLRGKE